MRMTRGGIVQYAPQPTPVAGLAQCLEMIGEIRLASVVQRRQIMRANRELGNAFITSGACAAACPASSIRA